MGGYFWVSPKIPIITGYAAKNVCSCHFAADRPLENIEKYDLSFFPINKAKIHIDESQKFVEASILGMGTQKAQYKAGLGCILIQGDDDYNIEFPPFTRNHENGIQFKHRDSLNQVIDDKLLKEAIDSAFIDEFETRTLLGIYKGAIIFEKYGDGLDEDTPQLGWSMTKSFTNALIGILVNQGKLRIEDNALFDTWLEDDRKDITINDLLQMNSGLAWEEEYGHVSDITKLLYLSEDIVDLAKNKELEYPIGTHWYYASGTSNLICGILRKTLGNTEDYLSFPKRSLFDPLGMNTAFMETDESGNFIGSSFGFASARDWGRFGMLYLNDGKVDSTRILPEGWVEYSTTPVNNKTPQYGAQIWLNHDQCRFKDLPSSMYSFNGFQGQCVAVFPEQDLVLVRLGHNSDFDFNRIFSMIIEALPNE